MSNRSLYLHVLGLLYYCTEPCVFIEYFHLECGFIFISELNYFMTPFDCYQYFMIFIYDIGVCLSLFSVFFRFWKIINARTLPIHIVRACKCFDKCHSIICLVMEICKHTHTNTKRVYSDALLIWLYITLHAMIYNRHHFSFILTT